MKISKTNLPFVPNASTVFTQLCKEIHQSLEQKFKGEQNQPRIYVDAFITWSATKTSSQWNQHFGSFSLPMNWTCSQFWVIQAPFSCPWHNFYDLKIASRGENGTTSIWYLKVDGDTRLVMANAFWKVKHCVCEHADLSVFRLVGIYFLSSSLDSKAINKKWVFNKAKR